MTGFQVYKSEFPVWHYSVNIWWLIYFRMLILRPRITIVYINILAITAHFTCGVLHVSFSYRSQVPVNLVHLTFCNSFWCALEVYDQNSCEVFVHPDFPMNLFVVVGFVFCRCQILQPKVIMVSSWQHFLCMSVATSESLRIYVRWFKHLNNLNLSS
jgi:hypothetical protein